MKRIWNIIEPKLSFGIIWLPLIAMIIFLAMTYAIVEFNDGDLNFYSFDDIVIVVGLVGAWWAFRNEDLKRGWIKYNYYERKDGTRVIIVHNAGRTAAENVILHYATVDRQILDVLPPSSSMFDIRHLYDSNYSMHRIPEISPGQEFALEIKPSILDNINWNKSINKSDVQLSYKHGSNQTKHFSRVKLDKSFMWYKDKVTFL